MIKQRTTNDCVIATLANFICIKKGIALSSKMYDIIESLLPVYCKEDDLQRYLNGEDGLHDYFVLAVCDHFGIRIVCGSDFPSSEPCMAAVPMKNFIPETIHFVCWDGTQVLDPIMDKYNLPKVKELTSGKYVIWREA